MMIPAMSLPLTSPVHHSCSHVVKIYCNYFSLATEVLSEEGRGSS